MTVHPFDVKVVFRDVDLEYHRTVKRCSACIPSKSLEQKGSDQTNLSILADPLDDVSTPNFSRALVVLQKLF